MEGLHLLSTSAVAAFLLIDRWRSDAAAAAATSEKGSSEHKRNIFRFVRGNLQASASASASASIHCWGAVQVL